MRRRRRDVIGLLHLAAGLALLVFGLSQLAFASGWRGAVIGLFGGTAVLVLYVVHAMETKQLPRIGRRPRIPEQRRPDPRELIGRYAA